MKKFLSTFLTLVIMVLVIGTASALAAGVENLPAGSYEIGSFSFTDYNVTPVKTVLGTKIRFSVLWRPSDEDLGTGFQKLSLQVLDADTGRALTPVYTSEMGYDDTWYWEIYTPEISVNYGQRIQIWFDVSTLNPAEANGNYRRAYIHSFRSIVR